MSSILYSEILEQPAVIRRLMELEAAPIVEIGRQVGQQDIRYILMAARGTSDNAARYGQYIFGAQSRLTVALATPSLFSIYRRPPRLEGALVIGISQSGQSPDIVEVLREARRQHAPTLAITNDTASPLASTADYVIDLHAGQERSIAATKTYTAQLAAIAMLAMSLAGLPLRNGPLEQIPALMERALRSESAARCAAERLAAADRCVVIGRGYNYATAFEIALKLKELSYVEAEPYSSADFKHGPIAMIEPGFPVLMVVIGETLRHEMLELRDTLRDKGAQLVIIGDDDSLRHPDDLWLPAPMPDLPEWLTPLPAVVPGQWLAYHLAIARGGDPDHPRTIRKVTLTR